MILCALSTILAVLPLPALSTPLVDDPPSFNPIHSTSNTTTLTHGTSNPRCRQDGLNPSLHDCAVALTGFPNVLPPHIFTPARGAIPHQWQLPKYSYYGTCKISVDFLPDVRPGTTEIFSWVAFYKVVAGAMADCAFKEIFSRTTEDVATLGSVVIGERGEVRVEWALWGGREGEVGSKEGAVS